MDYKFFLAPLGGLGLFIYGIKLMGHGLQKAAGDKLKKILEVLTTNSFKAVLVGTFVTALIQSSSATTVMTVGFVNAGLINLFQAAGVIMGANMGTTITAQLIAFKLTGIAPLILVSGAITVVFSKNKRHVDIGEIVLGFGIIFIGMAMMESTLLPIKQTDGFKSFILTLSNNPLMGLFIGIGMTAIIQSSSATIGILMALAAGSAIPMEVALPILLGDNIGSCITAMLASIGTSKNARRAALIHLSFNVIGTIIFMYLFNPVLALMAMLGGDIQRQIANSHTLFNVGNVIIQIWFIGFLVKLVNKVIPGEDEAPSVRMMEHLDARLLETPSVAMGQVLKEIIRMGRIASESLDNSLKAFVDNDERMAVKVEEYEETVNFLEREITDYMVQLSNTSLSEHQLEVLASMFHVVNDIERVGDHADNLRELALHKISNRLEFSERAISDIKHMYDITKFAIDNAISALDHRNVTLAEEVIEAEDRIDTLEKHLRIEHVDRLNRRECTPASGTIFLDILSNLERVGDHATNIAQVVIVNR